MKLTLISPNQVFVQSLPIKEVVVPCMTGELQILSMHTPLVSMLDTGVLKFVPQSQTDLIVDSTTFVLHGGHMEVSPSGDVLVLADIVEEKKSLNFSEAENEFKKISQKLGQSENLTSNEITRLQKDLKVVQARLKTFN